MSIYKRRIKVKKEVSAVDNDIFINFFRENLKAVYIGVAVAVLVAGGLYYGKRISNKKNLELSDRLYADLNGENVDLDKVNGYLEGQKGNIADIGQLYLAGAYYESGRYEDALAAYKRLSKSASEARFKVSAYLGIGHSNQRLGKYQEAVEAFKLAFDNTEEDPYKVEAKLSLGLAYESLGKKEEAASHYKWLKDNFPNSQFVSPAFLQK